MSLMVCVLFQISELSTILVITPKLPWCNFKWVNRTGRVTKHLKVMAKLGVVSHKGNPTTQETEAGGAQVQYGPAWAT